MCSIHRVSDDGMVMLITSRDVDHAKALLAVLSDVRP
jgi:hypothetical protein